MAITYEDVIPSPVANATTKKMLSDGVHRTYNITANNGYVLHDKELDNFKLDEDGNLTDEVIPGYTRGMTSCRWDYDFTANPREFYTVAENTVPSDNIYGGGDNTDHETI